MFEDYFKSHSPKGSCNFERIFKYSQARFIRLTSAVSNSIQLSAAEMRSGKCVKRRVFNMADEGTGKQSTQILRNQNEKKKDDNAAVCVVIRSGCIGTRMAKFLIFLWRGQSYACSIN